VVTLGYQPLLQWGEETMRQLIRKAPLSYIGLFLWFGIFCNSRIGPSASHCPVSRHAKFFCVVPWPKCIDGLRMGSNEAPPPYYLPAIDPVLQTADPPSVYSPSALPPSIIREVSISPDLKPRASQMSSGTQPLLMRTAPSLADVVADMSIRHKNQP
jgi:hypothetical protein